MKKKILKFKVGDKVIVKKDGRVGFIIPDELSYYDYRVEFKDYTELFYEYNLELIEEPKPIKQNRLEELINALNTLGSLGIELDVKITAEINGKKVEL